MPDRTRRRATAFLLAFGVPAAALVPALAEGQPAKQEKQEKAAEGHNDPENVTAISQYMETLVKGNERFVAHDTTAAIDHYKKAIQLSPKNPFGLYLLAEAHLSTGNIGEAEAAITEAVANSDARNPVLRGRCLFVAADIYERQKKWDQAKTTWQQYAELAAKHGDDGGLFPQSSAERLKAIQKVLDMEKAYVAVRERIAAEKTNKSDAGAKK
jgi:tetratricopeptide (TPR) repeat protein